MVSFFLGGGGFLEIIPSVRELELHNNHTKNIHNVSIKRSNSECNAGYKHLQMQNHLTGWMEVIIKVMVGCQRV